MSHAKATDIAYVRFTAPDLDLMEAFLTDFGLARAARTDGALYMKGLDGAPFAHVTEKGEPGFAGFGFELEDSAALEALAAAADRPIEDINEPGGGRIVRLTDPDGFRVDAVVRSHGPQTKPQTRAALNDGRASPRLNSVSRVPGGPAQVVRLGHAVLNVKDYRTSQKWYEDHFGLIVSDEIEPEPGVALGAFMRCDRGDMPVDHHTLFLVGVGASKYNHAAFEVVDFDSLMSGHTHLKNKSYRAEWGVGRHILGSQIFDYWRDPWGHTVEHWTDGDLFDAASGSRKAPLPDLLGVQWGPEAPPTMME
ncbi:MAG: VOC family protein [Hyphomonadaceae bacterium]